METTSERDNPLLGTWHLVRWDITYSDGRAPTLPFGDAARGLIVYTHDGTMSACIARGGRKPRAERLGSAALTLPATGRGAAHSPPYAATSAAILSSFRG